MVNHKRILSAILVSFFYLSYSAPILAEEQYSDGHADEHEHHHGKGGKKSKHEHHHTN